MNDQILLMFGVFYTLFPLCLLLLPATVSSEFAALKEETTKLHLTSSVKNHLRVRSLETYLNHMNRGQGIGITVFGLKLDLNTLQSLLSVLATGVLLPSVSYMLQLS